jgi:hypothetical protein
MRIAKWSLLTCALLVIAGWSSAHAVRVPSPGFGGQVQAVPDRINIAVQLADAIDRDDARAKVIRRKDHVPQDLILLTSSANASDLRRAITAIAVSHRVHGTDLPNNLVMYISEPGAQARSASAPSVRRPTGSSPASQRRADVQALALSETARVIATIASAPVAAVSGSVEAPTVIYATRISNWTGSPPTARVPTSGH